MYKKTALALLWLGCLKVVSAQDIHYSQFYASPLTLNPALTGINDCNYRLAGMYRNQWRSVTDPYVTPSISFDINNVLQRWIKTGVLSAGGLILNDKAGTGELSNMSIMASVAYARPLTADRKLNGSVGLQLGYVQKKLDFTKLLWESQFNGESFDPTLSSNENFNDKFSYIDLNAGLYVSYFLSPKADLFGGAAIFHLIPPKESFLNKDNKLGMRMVGHGGFRYKITDQFSIIPQVLYMTQTKAQEINLGGSFAYVLNNDVKLFGGAYYRLNDAAIPVIGIDYKQIRLGLSYDVNISSLSDASKGRGGFELSLGYTGCLGGFVLDKPIFFCPRY
ncbi:MAG: PorP/SprF family type IX secretion system membrane protein [Chitinophagales bacterium]|nr:PorP/SprF family type IX secretion system membrane protein [Chitinophagales bacterium]MDW8427567.1 PorP/SprF family type IX secretion system membrane protein [Chitinophagales bacterium]